MQRWFGEVSEAMYMGTNDVAENEIADSDDSKDDNSNNDVYGKIDTFVGYVDAEKIQ
jgi:hypothetical protein